MTEGTDPDLFGLAEATRAFIAATHRDGHSPTSVFLKSWLISLTATLSAAAGVRSDPRIDQILTKLADIKNQETHMSAEMDTLTAQVHANSDAVDSAKALINGIADRIAAAGVDPAALSALTAELKAKDAELSEAVTANTPVPPADTTGGGGGTVGGGTDTTSGAGTATGAGGP